MKRRKRHQVKMAGLESWHFLVLNTRDRVGVSFLSPGLILERDLAFSLKDYGVGRHPGVKHLGSNTPR